jgi:hypothetical protein
MQFSITNSINPDHRGGVSGLCCDRIGAITGGGNQD